MLEILLDLSSSFSVMGRRLTKLMLMLMLMLMSDVSNIKEKQDSLQLSLSVLIRSRAAEMEHQRGQPSAEHGLQQPRRDPTSSSGPMVTPSTTSTPLERKQRAWYVTDSFAEQLSPLGSRCANLVSRLVANYQLYVYHLYNSKGRL